MTPAGPAELLLPPVEVSASEVATRAALSGRSLVVLDDDPTGTQAVRDAPVLTTWAVADLRWGLRHPLFYVLTNTRSLDAEGAAARNREVLEALVTAAEAQDREFVIVSRSDSTLRGHFPLETDVISRGLLDLAGIRTDGVIMVPAYPEGGRVTIDSVHWVNTARGWLRAAESEFAADATFGYAASDLREYVAEKTGGRLSAGDVLRVTITDLRTGPEAVTKLLLAATGAQPIVVDAVCEQDLRVLALAVLSAEALGKHYVYRTGPSFVRARAGLELGEPLTPGEVKTLTEAAQEAVPAGNGRPPGLVVVGSHVAQTTRQLEELRGLGGCAFRELDAARLADPRVRRDETSDAARWAAAAAADGNDAVLFTSRSVRVGPDARASLDMAREISAGVVETVRQCVAEIQPAWIVAKGGITSSDVATSALGIRRAWVRGTLLPGIVALWQPVVADRPAIPYVVFAGNVGSDSALRQVVRTLRADSE
jgi:uncharacterized protein YgbK (DUF1537 family)